MKYIIFFLISIHVFAQEGLSVVAVGEANTVKDKIAIQINTVGNESQTLARSVEKQLLNNFAFYKKIFDVISESSSNDSDIEWSKWKKNDVRYFIRAVIAKKEKSLFELFEVGTKKKLHTEKILLDEITLRGQVHSAADHIYQAITGKESIFKSKIVFVTDRHSTRRKTIKELYIMDFDGENKERLTRHLGIVISPAISPDRKKVVYSLIRYTQGKRNVNLYIYDLRTRRSTLLSSKPGLNSGAVFAPDGQSIYLTLSVSGDAEIYEMNLRTKRLRQVTKHSAEDVDPSINKAGNKMTFLSSRPGKAMIYLADANGTEKNVKRISYVGQYNATPRFSPDGSEIVFSSWVDNRFDLYRIDSEGTELVRLTKNFGSNESPTYSNDGQFIAFASQRVISKRQAVQNIYIMDREGEIIGAVTEDFGDCLSPRWSK